jgi:acyl carrier protein
MFTKETLQNLLTDVLLLDRNEFRFDLKREDVNTWDSLAVVALAVGIQETFGYHMRPDEAVTVSSVEDIIKILSANGIFFND